MTTTDVKLAKLVPPPTRDFADPDKLIRMGAFDWQKYSPIIVEQDRGRLVVQDGLTRVEAAKQAGIEVLPAYLFSKSGS